MAIEEKSQNDIFLDRMKEKAKKKETNFTYSEVGVLLGMIDHLKKTKEKTK